MNTLEFLENYLDGTHEEALQFANDLDSVIQTEIEKHQAQFDKWHNYANEKPTIIQHYLIVDINGQYKVRLWNGMKWASSGLNVILWRELPPIRIPQGGGTE